MDESKDEQQTIAQLRMDLNSLRKVSVSYSGKHPPLHSSLSSLNDTVCCLCRSVVVFCRVFVSRCCSLFLSHFTLPYALLTSLTSHTSLTSLTSLTSHFSRFSLLFFPVFLNSTLSRHPALQEAGRADAKDKEVVRLAGVVASLDEERDRLTAELDEQAEAIEELRRTNAGLRSDVSKAEEAVRFSQREVIRLSQAIDGRDRQIDSLRHQLDDAKARAVQSDRRTEGVQRELSAAAEDIMAMTRENQVISAELTALRADKMALEQYAGGANDQLQQLQQRLSEIETDKVELLTVYQAVCDERKHLSAEVQAAGELRSKARLFPSPPLLCVVYLVRCARLRLCRVTAACLAVFGAWAQLEEQTAALGSEVGNLRAALAAEQERRDIAERAFAAMQASLDDTTRQVAERLHGRPVDGQVRRRCMSVFSGPQTR